MQLQLRHPQMGEKLLRHLRIPLVRVDAPDFIQALCARVDDGPIRLRPWGEYPLGDFLPQHFQRACETADPLFAHLRPHPERMPGERTLDALPRSLHHRLPVILRVMPPHRRPILVLPVRRDLFHEQHHRLPQLAPDLQLSFGHHAGRFSPSAVRKLAHSTRRRGHPAYL